MSKPVNLPPFFTPYPEFLNEVLSCLSLKELAKSEVFRTCKEFKKRAEKVYELILRRAKTQNFFQDCLHFSQHTLGVPTTRKAILDRMSSITFLNFNRKGELNEMNAGQNRWEKLDAILSSNNARHLLGLSVYARRAHYPGPPPDYVSDNCVAAIAQSCPSLRSLMISYAMQMTDAGTAHLAGLKHLTCVSFYNALTLSNRTCEVLAQLPSIKEVHLDGCVKITHVGITILLQNAPKLRNLSVGGDIGDSFEEQTLIARSIAAHGRLLTHLSMRDGYYPHTEILQIAAKCKKLIQIDLTGNTNRKRALKDPAEFAEQMRKAKPKLEILNLGKSPLELLGIQPRK